jgi:hypothetical protein
MRIGALAVMLGLIAAPASAQTLPQAEFEEIVSGLLNDTQATSDVELRVGALYDLECFIQDRAANMQRLAPELIERLAALLRDRDYSVRVRAPALLAVAGSHAQRAIPALDAAFKTALNSGQRDIISGAEIKAEICAAFQAIGSNPEPSRCIGGAFH